MKRLPTIVITGFLGAGKTTLLNRLLQDASSGMKAGVIVNDFGKLNVDARLVRKGEHPLLELSNGCVCCTLQLGLSAAVQTLAARNDLDLLVIEASGISVSSALLHALNATELAHLARLSKVIAVVDARRYARVLHSLPLIRDQIAHADLIVLNHCDEVDAAMIDAARNRLREDNRDAAIAVTDHGNVAVERLFERTWSGSPAHRTNHGSHWHAYEVVLPGDFDTNQLRNLADQLPESVERVKGFVTRDDECYIFQKVGPFPASLELWSDRRSGNSANTLVIVASEPVEDQLAQIFRGASIVVASSDTRSPS